MNVAAATVYWPVLHHTPPSTRLRGSSVRPRQTDVNGRTEERCTSGGGSGWLNTYFYAYPTSMNVAGRTQILLAKWPEPVLARPKTGTANTWIYRPHLGSGHGMLMINKSAKWRFRMGVSLSISFSACRKSATRSGASRPTLN